jgi:hypothetical protein
MDDSVTTYIYDEPLQLRKKVDVLARITEDYDRESYDVEPISETETFVSNLYSLFQENSVLKHSLKNLWKVHKYNEEYIAFLLGSYSEEEFRGIAENFAETTQEDMNANQIAIASDIICSTLSLRLESTDLSVMLNVTPSYIEENLRLIEYSPDACEGE